MQRNSQMEGTAAPKGYMSRFRNGGKSTQAFKMGKLPLLGQLDAKYRPYADESVDALYGSSLVEPLCIEDVVALLGWAP